MSADLRRHINWDAHSKDEVIDMLMTLHADYEDRGHAMRQTGDMVRSLYAPKNEKLNKENGKLKGQLKFEKARAQRLFDVVEDFVATGGDLGFALLEHALAEFKSGRTRP
jgi:2-keto-3-deoxy-L-rhamnonate aldolase RhmA